MQFGDPDWTTLFKKTKEQYRQHSIELKNNVNSVSIIQICPKPTHKRSLKSANPHMKKDIIFTLPQ